MTKEQERDELHRAIWQIANDLRGSVDGWDFKSYVLGLLFYRFISENLTSFINKEEQRTGNMEFYANFLIVNGAVLVPTYNSSNDKLAISQLKIAFPNHKVVGVDCLPLIKQHGSLHCVTMQLPEGTLK